VTAICFVDVATTGTNPRVHELWEIGLIRREPTSPHEDDAAGDAEFAWQVYPNLRRAEPRALQLARFYDRCVPRTPVHGHVVTRPVVNYRPGRPPHNSGTNPTTRSIAGDAARLLDGAVLVAVNAGVNAVFLDRFLNRHGNCPTWNYHLVEVLSLAAGRLRLPPPWNFTTVNEALLLPDPPEEERHTGLGGARRVRDIFDQVYAAEPAMQPPQYPPRGGGTD
jgi:hypothetical protein